MAIRSPAPVTGWTGGGASASSAAADLSCIYRHLDRLTGKLKRRDPPRKLTEPEQQNQSTRLAERSQVLDEPLTPLPRSVTMPRRKLEALVARLAMSFCSTTPSSPVAQLSLDDASKPGPKCPFGLRYPLRKTPRNVKEASHQFTDVCAVYEAKKDEHLREFWLRRRRAERRRESETAAQAAYAGKSPPPRTNLSPSHSPSPIRCARRQKLLGFRETMEKLTTEGGLGPKEAESVLTWGVLAIKTEDPQNDGQDSEDEGRETSFCRAHLEDRSWESHLQSLLRAHCSVLHHPSPLLEAAEQLQSPSCRSLEKAQECLAWARSRYSIYGSSGVLAVATCRWWSSGEPPGSEFLPPSTVVNMALRDHSLRQVSETLESEVSEQLENVLDAVVLVIWALEALPPAPEFERRGVETFRLASWIFPGFPCYALKAHFPFVGAEMTRCDFLSASVDRVQSGRLRWVYRMDGRYPLVTELAQGSNAAADVGKALEAWGRAEVAEGKPVSLPGIPYDVVWEGGKRWLVRRSTVVDEAEEEEECPKNQRFELLCAPMATLFVIENSRGFPLNALCEPDCGEKGMVVFPPFSRFALKSVSGGFPGDTPDEVRWRYLGGPAWATVMYGYGWAPRLPRTEKEKAAAQKLKELSSASAPSQKPKTEPKKKPATRHSPSGSRSKTQGLLCPASLRGCKPSGLRSMASRPRPVPGAHPQDILRHFFTPTHRKPRPGHSPVGRTDRGRVVCPTVGGKDVVSRRPIPKPRGMCSRPLSARPVPKPQPKDPPRGSPSPPRRLPRPKSRHSPGWRTHRGCTICSAMDCHDPQHLRSIKYSNLLSRRTKIASAFLSAEEESSWKQETQQTSATSARTDSSSRSGSRARDSEYNQGVEGSFDRRSNPSSRSRSNSGSSDHNPRSQLGSDDERFAGGGRPRSRSRSDSRSRSRSAGSSYSRRSSHTHSPSDEEG
eukprot:RCo007427